MYWFVVYFDVDVFVVFVDMIGEIEIEFLGDVVCQFQMLFLIVIDWNMCGVVKQDVGCYQVWIGVKIQ